jgi:hypothetical protein
MADLVKAVMGVGELDEGIYVPYTHAGILTSVVPKSWAYDVTRENRHLPRASGFPNSQVLRDSFLWPYLMSGHDVELPPLLAPDGDSTTRYYCAAVLNPTHGTMVGEKWEQSALLHTGFVHHGLICDCLLSDTTLLDQTFFSSITAKHETAILALFSVMRRLLWVTLNPPIKIRVLPYDGRNDIYGVCDGVLEYHSLCDYGKKQRLALTIDKQNDGSYTVRNPVSVTDRTQKKACVVCGFTNTSGPDEQRLILGLSCRHYICEHCNPYFWGINRSGFVCGEPTDADMPRCPKCAVFLLPTLTTPFDGLEILRAPVPIYHYGVKPVYTRPCLDSTLPTFNRHIRWFLEAVVQTNERIAEVEVFRFNAYAAVHSVLPADRANHYCLRALYNARQKADASLTAWRRVSAFLETKTSFVQWCYSWDLPFPKELLNQDSLYYKTVLERGHYNDLCRHADSFHTELRQLCPPVVYHL